MSILEQKQFWISFLVGLAMAVGTYPYDLDMYIPSVLTVAVFCLNVFSAILFSTFIYLIWTKCMSKKT